MKKIRTVELTTDYENDIADIPFSEYPRPQLRRGSYVPLNGKWNFKIENNGKNIFTGEINVPFAPESRISGVMREIKDDDLLVYII